ncbi:hypothetical protein IMZ48_32815 [Candidatus Bathyarchaeota archaeon]|nr:hypothetical protein [Candidatus Bathyarchaeota archaeon]
MAGEDEFEVEYKMTNTEEYPASFTDCHSHGGDMFCVDEEGEDVAVKVGGEEHEGHEEEGGEEESGGGENCHFHAGVE